MTKEKKLIHKARGRGPFSSYRRQRMYFVWCAGFNVFPELEVAHLWVKANCKNCRKHKPKRKGMY